MRKERDKKLELGLDAADLKSPKNKGLMSSIKQLDEQAETDRQTENGTASKANLAVQ